MCAGVSAGGNVDDVKMLGAFETQVGYSKKVIVSPAVHPRLFEPLHLDMQSVEQSSLCLNHLFPMLCFLE